MHLTVRMAWHDNNWDGRICQDPKSNTYCIGSNSLLSNRLRKNRDLDLEIKNAGKQIDQIGDYLPPCYWSANAFSKNPATIWHDHPWLKKKIQGKIDKHSMFTWPFKISFTSDEEKEKWGEYPPPHIVNERIQKFIEQFPSRSSLVFFYLNYDNPISLHENEYVLVGCAPIKEITTTGNFDFTNAELEQQKKNKQYRNLSTQNWALHVSYDFDRGVLLPYKNYLDHIKIHKSDEYMLDEMQVTINDNMRKNFKYVAMGMNDDSCLYLLTQLRKSLDKIKEHGIVDIDLMQSQQQHVDALLKQVWTQRGIYPGLGSILDVIGDVEESDRGIGAKIVDQVRINVDSTNTLDDVLSILTDNLPVPKYLNAYENIIEDIRVNISDENIPLLEKLSLFSLTPTQIGNILHRYDSNMDLDKIVKNPYILCEEYLPDPSKTYTQNKVMLDDVGIPLFMIDIGMFPDREFLRRNIELQNLKPDAPERIRVIIRDYLKSCGENGDCFATLDRILAHIHEHPLFYKDRLQLDERKLVSKDGKYAKHFNKNIFVEAVDDNSYFYLQEIWDAEHRLSKFVRSLLARKDYDYDNSLDIDLESEANNLANGIEEFPKSDFVQEREQLIKGIMTKSLYIVTGIPGSGKTEALRQIIKELKNRNEDVTLLAPTGKAALRLGNGAKTIDKMIYEHGYDDILTDIRKIVGDSRPRPRVENLIIDESSMIDLVKLDVLIRMITDAQGNVTAKRVIFVGDENQLPPIGYGRPFYDMIEMIRKEYKNLNRVKLQVNCRQKNSEILEISSLFEYGKDDGEGLLSTIASENYESKSGNFTVVLWNDDADLERKIDTKLDQIFTTCLNIIPSRKASKLNLLFGLDQNGYVDKKNPESVTLEKFQILSPYKNRGYGTTSHLNEYIKMEYRDNDMYFKDTPFLHSDKIISTTNKKKYGEMILANGSIGVINKDVFYTWNPYLRKKEQQTRIYFSKAAKPNYYLPPPIEDYDVAYAITVHKSQGSEFDYTFVVIPQHRALLSKELMYTALTRAKQNVTLFLQNTPDGDPVGVLDYARRRSDVRLRHTSVFSKPTDISKIYEPKKGLFVKSKVEYILFTKLYKSEVDFKYEKPLECRTQNDEKIVMRPDFTILVNDTEYYLEHLGMLDDFRYRKSWERKRKTYEHNGLLDRLITTDDLKGIQNDCIDDLLNDILKMKITTTKNNNFSLHHYTTYR